MKTAFLIFFSAMVSGGWSSDLYNVSQKKNCGLSPATESSCNCGNPMNNATRIYNNTNSSKNAKVKKSYYKKGSMTPFKTELIIITGIPGNGFKFVGCNGDCSDKTVAVAYEIDGGDCY